MIFIDADAFLAMAMSLDSNHKRAIHITKRLKDQKEELVTSAFVFGEVVTVLSQREGRNAALRFIDEFSLSGIILVEVDSLLREKGVVIFKKQTSKNVSFTDCINVAIIQQEKIREVFSFDRVYKKNGLRLLEYTL